MAARAVHLRVQGATKRFGAFTALDDVSLEVESGKLVCFLGPSGCGKTTLLRVIAGLEMQDAGTIEIGGRDVTRLPPAQRDFGIVFQSYALFPNLTVARNVGYGLVNRRKARREIAARVAELLQLVGMPEQGDKYPAQLSGGQQQRVALARALASAPSLLLLDEPMSALDARVRVRLRDEIKALQRRLGVTTIMVTHDQEEALAMADRIVVMNHGRVEQVGSAAEIYGRPGSAFVADFVGNINLFEGKVLSRDTTGARISSSGGLTIHTENAGDAETGRNVWFAIRPEKIRVSSRKPAADGVNAVEGEIWDIAYLGDMTVFNVRLEDGRIVKTSSLNSVRVSEDALSWNDRAWISFQPDAGVVLTK